MDGWARRIADGDVRALAQAATGIENRDPEALEVLARTAAAHGPAPGWSESPERRERVRAHSWMPWRASCAGRAAR